MSISHADIEEWARAAEKRSVRVSYRVAGQQAVTTRTMKHSEYMQWANNAQRNGYQLVRAEQTEA